MNAEKFRRDYPDLFFLDVDDSPALTEYLRRIGVLDDEEEIELLARAGEGNMNLTVRARTAARSLIVKQSRPWVERYPEIAAPWDRVLGEARFYLLASAHREIAQRLPQTIEVDAQSHVLVLEDFGEASDFTSLYGGASLRPETAAALSAWLSELHRIEFANKSRASLTSLPMRRLNHEHLFRFPLAADNGLDLDAITPRLRALADEVASDAAYVARVAELGEIYLQPGPALLHGDFFPGSWLETDAGFAVIDPEFAYFGRPEFDVGVLLGHLRLAGQGDETTAAVVEAYRTPVGFEWPLALEFSAVEIMRRLIGVAQLPLAAGLDEKRRLLDLSREMIKGDDPLASAGLLANSVAAGAS